MGRVKCGRREGKRGTGRKNRNGTKEGMEKGYFKRIVSTD
jgi:hypothetical protein